ncbi:MAG: YncE family protein, partial [Candidatus Binatia bacterium]
MQDGFILVLNTLSDDISIIDPKDDSVVEAVRVGETPRDLVYVPGSRRVFVTLSGTGEVGMFDLAERRITCHTKVGVRPGHIYLHPSQEEVWVAND